MTFALGLLGLLQITFLPGWLWLRWAGVRTHHWLEAAIYAFGASLIANHLLVWLLVGARIHWQATWLVIVAIECLWLLRLTGPALWIRLTPDEPPRAGLGGALALAAVIGLVAVAAGNWGSVYSLNDDVLSWDRWAMDFSQNRLPYGPDFYPQLLPANWSVTYALLGTSEIKMFGKAIMPLFPLGSALLAISVAWRRRDGAYYWTAGLIGFLWLVYLGPIYLRSGYADVPSAFFAFLAFYVLYAAGRPPDGQTGALALVFASGAALTKQGALPAPAAVAVYLLVAGWFGKQGPAGLSRPLRASAAAGIGSVAAWYGYRIYEVLTGRAITNLPALLTSVHGGRGPGERLAAAAGLLMGAGGEWGVVPFLFLAAAAALALLLPRTRALTLWLVAPAAVLWGLTFSYEVRTAAIWMPFAGFVGGVALSEVWQRAWQRAPAPWQARSETGWFCGSVLLGLAAVLAIFGDKFDPLRQHWLMPLLSAGAIVAAASQFRMPALSSGLELRFPHAPSGLVAAMLIAGAVLYPGTRLLEQQVAERRATVGYPEVNRRLYAKFDSGELRQPIQAGYWYLEFLPGWKPYYRPLLCGPECSLEQVLRAVRDAKEAPFLLTEDPRMSPTVTRQIGFCKGLELMMEQRPVRLFRVDRTRLASDPSGCPMEPPAIEKLFPAVTEAGVTFNLQRDNQAAIGVACRNASRQSVVVWAGERLDTAFGSPEGISASVPGRLYAKPGKYAIEIVERDTGVRSKPAYFEVTAPDRRP